MSIIHYLDDNSNEQKYKNPNKIKLTKLYVIRIILYN